MKKKFKLWFIGGGLAFTLFLSSAFVNNYFELSKNLDIFSSLYKELNIYYVDSVKPEKLIKVGIDAMLASLDPYTNFIPESESDDYRFMTTGQYGGIGSLVRSVGDYVYISEPYEGYPANKAGLEAGDKILQIDGVNVKGKNTTEISKLLKGKPKTEVKVLIEREGEPKPMEKILMREEILVKSVPYYTMLNSTTGYVRLSNFTEKATKEVREAIRELKEKNDVKSLILDLRGNPGGLLNEAINITNLFVSRGKEIVTTKGKVKEWEKSYKALNNPVDTTIPLVILVNSNSASASEIVTGAIQDLDRGVIIGQRSFGKGLVQTTRQLSYNTQLKITTAKYYIPSGRCIQAIDYAHRNEDGSVGKMPDSLMSMYKTHNGRAVYDGGGIAPDIITEPLQQPMIASNLITKAIIFDYATKYKKEHPGIVAASGFKLSDAEYQEFVTWASNKDYAYVTKTEKALDELKSAAEGEKYFEKINAEFELLKTKLAHNKKEDMLAFRQNIQDLLEEEIASRYYYQKGRIEAGVYDDKEIAKAVEVLNNKALYNSILDGTYKKEVASDTKK